MAARISHLPNVVFTNHVICSNWKAVMFGLLRRPIHCSCSLQTPDPGTDKGLVHKSPSKAEKISRAMKAYMERSKSHDAMLKEEIANYEIGKRHLANMMGLDGDSLTDNEIKSSIAYLLPSGLHAEKARPFMKHPYEVFPRRKAAQFGMDGRPFHFLFYTGKPNFYKLMYDITWKLEDLKKEEDKLLMKGLMYQELDNKLSLYGSEWISCAEVAIKMVEKINEKDHQQLVVLMERFAAHPLSYKEEEFIMKFRRKLDIHTFADKIKTPKVDRDGREYLTAKGKRKSAWAVVTVRSGGTGQVTINGRDLEYFPDTTEREQVMFPMQLVDKLGEIDVEAEVIGGGPSGQAGAIRYGLSSALTSFVSSDMVEKMRLAGLLTIDPRKRERKKPGQEGARKKFTWKKR